MSPVNMKGKDPLPPLWMPLRRRKHHLYSLVVLGVFAFLAAIAFWGGWVI